MREANAHARLYAREGSSFELAEAVQIDTRVCLTFLDGLMLHVQM